MVLKTKPWKSGTNKLSLSRQFRAACKKLERLNLTFLRTRFIFRKGQGIYWKKFFARKGPLPLPNRFLRPTRVHLGVLNHPHPPDLGFLPMHLINQASTTVFCSIRSGIMVVYCLHIISDYDVISVEKKKVFNWSSHTGVRTPDISVLSLTL